MTDRYSCHRDNDKVYVYDHAQGRYLLDEQGNSLVKSEEEARQFIATSHNDVASAAFFKNRPLIGHVDDNGALLGETLHVDNVDPQTARQQMRRSQALQDLCTAVFDRREAGGGTNFLRVSYDEFQVMYDEYQDAVKQGLASRCEFQPLSTYLNKIIQTDDQGNIKRKLRDIFSNEMGVWEPPGKPARIIILKDMGPGDAGERYHQVPAQLVTKE